MPTNFKFDAAIDDFSAWLIFFSLRTLAKDPSLWQLRTGTDQLLLSAGDLESPQDSEIILRLTKSSDAELQHIGLNLGRFLSMPANRVPSFRDEQYATPTVRPKWKPQLAPEWAQEPITPAVFVPVSLPQVPPTSSSRRKKRPTQTGSQRPKQPAAAAPTSRPASDSTYVRSSAINSVRVFLPDIPPTSNRQPKKSATRPPTSPASATRSVAGNRRTTSPFVEERPKRDFSPAIVTAAMSVVLLVILLLLTHVI